VREAVLAGKEVIFYKAGRTPEGKTATSGHTASWPGTTWSASPAFARPGAWSPRPSPSSRTSLLAQRLHGKKILGNRLAAVSGAGFEAVGMADNIQSDERSPDPPRQGAGELVEVKNPLDINPGADDEAHVKVVEALSADANVDALVIGLDPLSPAMRTLADTSSGRYSLSDPSSIASLLPKVVAALETPVVGVVDGGRLYDPWSTNSPAAAWRSSAPPTAPSAPWRSISRDGSMPSSCGGEGGRCAGNLDQSHAKSLPPAVTGNHHRRGQDIYILPGDAQFVKYFFPALDGLCHLFDEVPRLFLGQSETFISA
jgi:hypothetical protein